MGKIGFIKFHGKIFIPKGRKNRAKLARVRDLLSRSVSNTFGSRFELIPTVI